MSRSTERMNALTGGHMASASTLAQIGIGASGTGTAGRTSGGTSSDRTPGTSPDLQARDWLG